MAGPKVRIKEPTYTEADAAKILGMPPSHVAKIISGGDFDWATMAKLVVARKLWKSLPLQLVSKDTFEKMAVCVLAGPTPRAGCVRVRPDGQMIYVARGMDVIAKEGLYVHWDGTLKV